MDRMSPEAAEHYLGMWQCAGIIWHMWQVAEAPGGPTFCSLDADLAQKGPTSPSEGPDVSLLAHNFDILAFNVKNNVKLKVSLVSCFNDLILKLKVIWMI